MSLKRSPCCPNWALNYTLATKNLADFCHANRKKWLKTANIGKSEGHEKRGLQSQSPMIYKVLEDTAGVVKLVDALDSKSSGPCARASSTLASGTKQIGRPEGSGRLFY